MAKVLVAGGAGYIGGAVTECLLRMGIPFTVYDNLLYEPHYLKDVDFVYGDVRDTDRLMGLLPSYTHIIWLAAIVGDGACALTPELTKSVNYDAVEWLAENYKGRIIFTSTCSVYGEHHGEVDEAGITKPLSLYAETKLKAESCLDPESSLILRLGTAFGVSDTYSRPRMDLVANQMPVSAIMNNIITVRGGDQWRPMVHVYDIAEAITNNLFRPVRGTYNLASVNMKIKTLGEIISRMTGCSVTYEPLGADARDYRVSTTKALRDGIFNPATLHTIQDGVREFIYLIRSGRVKDSNNSVYFNVRHLGAKSV